MSPRTRNQTMPATLQCGCCQHNDTRLLCNFPDHTGDSVTLYLCLQCSALTPDYRHIPADDNTSKQTQYYEALWAAASQDASRQLVEDCRGIVHFYQQKGFLLPPDTQPHVIELGAGRGALLAALQREGYAPTGVEPAQGLVTHAYLHYGMNEATLQCMTADAFLTQLEQQKQPIDAAFLWHVIEHVQYPAQLLRKLGTQLSDKGVIVLQAPMPSSASLFPEHLYLLTRHTVFTLSQMSDLAVAFCDISHHEQFISFVLCKPQSGYALVAPPETAVLDTWIADMQSAIVDLHKTCAGQRNVINNYVHTAKEQHQRLHDRFFLLKQFLRLSLTRSKHG